jgi:transcriptional regulator with XRE-family HTH domain
MENIREEVKELQIGLKVRRLRQDRRMTLQDLADATGLSKPLLSQIENEQVIPPLGTLLRIAKAFKVGLQHFFQEEGHNEKCILTRAGESRRMYRRPTQNEPPQPYAYHSLAFGKKHRNMEPFLVEFEPRQCDKGLQVSHEGEEFLFLLEGSLELHYGEQIMTMEPGDSVYYDSAEPHGYISTGDGPTRAVAVIYSKGG